MSLLINGTVTSIQALSTTMPGWTAEHTGDTLRLRFVVAASNKRRAENVTAAERTARERDVVCLLEGIAAADDADEKAAYEGVITHHKETLAGARCAYQAVTRTCEYVVTMNSITQFKDGTIICATDRPATTGAPYVPVITRVPQSAAICRLAAPEQPRFITVSSADGVVTLLFHMSKGLPRAYDYGGIDGSVLDAVRIHHYIYMATTDRMLVIIGPDLTQSYYYNEIPVGARLLTNGAELFAAVPYSNTLHMWDNTVSKFVVVETRAPPAHLMLLRGGRRYRELDGVVSDERQQLSIAPRACAMFVGPGQRVCLLVRTARRIVLHEADGGPYLSARVPLGPISAVHVGYNQAADELIIYSNGNTRVVTNRSMKVISTHHYDTIVREW
jgi:hypothetical protein